MRHLYIVAYDIRDPARLRKVFKTVRGFGDALQLSVFRCDLSAKELVELKAKLDPLLHHGDDQVLFVQVGPVEGRAVESISTLGRRYEPPEQVALVL